MIEAKVITIESLDKRLDMLLEKVSKTVKEIQKKNKKEVKAKNEV